jgi:Pyruvate/2-oxoacid:ferredoxin oxidoreductase delta subunit
MLEAARRIANFEEVVGGLDESNALYEARRCLSCGNCFECDNCYGVCPDNAIVKLGPGKTFKFDYDYCKGYGLWRQRDGGGGDLRKEAAVAAASFQRTKSAHFATSVVAPQGAIGTVDVEFFGEPSISLSL